MYFEQIEVLGFKSFADKTVIRFEPGITAIVGPNGCGKSNVSDAIRWVLGEQSPKSLRGSNMQDVIFSGTQSRKQVSYCEVTLQFKNTDQIEFCDTVYDVITISRKLYRSGESEYYINKNLCRMKDIVDLMRKAGLGRGGYSIVGQGKMDEIVSSKPIDRRAIFEEATGISKFKSQKLESERKLERTLDNLTRLNDIMGELEIQLVPLKKKAEDLKKYNDLKEKLKFNEVNNFLCQSDTASSDKARMQNKLDAVTEEYEKKLAEQETNEKEYVECLNNIRNADQHITELQERKLDISIRLESKKGEILSYRSQASIYEKNIEKSKEIIESLDRKGEQYKAEIEKNSFLKEEKIRSIESLTSELANAKQDFTVAIERIADRENQSKNTRDEVIESINSLAEIESDLSALTAERKQLESRKIVIARKLDEYRVELKNIQNQLKELRIQISNAEREKDEKIAQKNKEISHREALKTQRDNAEKTYYACKDKRDNVQLKLNLYSSMHTNLEGFQRAVKQLVGDAKQNPNIAKSMYGVVSELITVPQKFETAIEIALGAAIQNIVVPSRENAKFLIEYLKDHRYGRATFLPIDGIKPRRLDAVERALLKEKGCLGVASELIRFEAKYAPAIEALLGRTVIADTLESAVAISKNKGANFKIVTLDGDVISAGGAMTGGSRENKADGVLGYERMISEAEQQLKSANVQLEKALGELNAKKAAIEECAKNVSRLESEQHRADIDITSLTEKMRKAEIDVEDKRRLIVEFEEDLKGHSDKISEIEKSQNEINEFKKQASGRRQEADSEIERFDAVGQKLRLERDKLNDKLTELKVRITAEEAARDAVGNEIINIGNMLISNEADITREKREIERNKGLIDGCNEAVARIKAGVEGGSELDSIIEKLTNYDQYKEDLNAKRDACDSKRKLLNDEIFEINERRSKLSYNVEKVDADIQFLRQQIEESYGLTTEQMEAFRDGNYSKTSTSKEISKLKRALNEIGGVDGNAEEEYENVNKRYQEMFTQRQDLEKAEQDLRKIISDLTEEMIQTFTAGFRTINENFTAIFKELFGGGNAYLKLEPTEGGTSTLDDGIEIIAEPPGKKLQSVSLLSGGEKTMTAISILFAILKLRPMPFCVLDEIEAALDDANVDRIARYLHRFSKQTQFIVITHRKPTMALADALYGVTMEEKGVSKMISVKLGDVEKITKENH